MEYTTKNAEETKKLGKSMGSLLKGGEVLAFVGDLGTGKTTFIQGIAEGLGIAHRILSPTFVLLREYPNAWGGKVYHVDLYRLEGNVQAELKNLGMTDVLEDKKNIVLIEWAEKARAWLPRNAKWFYFEHTGEHTRKIIEKGEDEVIN